MRVAHVITRMIIGGAQENTLLNCLDLIREHGDDVLLITGPALGPEGDLLSQGRAGELPVQLLPSLRRAIHPRRDLAASQRDSKGDSRVQARCGAYAQRQGRAAGPHVAWQSRACPRSFTPFTAHPFIPINQRSHASSFAAVNGGRPNVAIE